MEEKENSDIAFISRTALNNGVSSYVEEFDNTKPYNAGLITIALGGSIGSTFLQTSQFYTGQNIAVLKPKEDITTSVKLFLATIIKKESDIRFIAFGRELNKHIKKDFTVRLPVNEFGKPDWKFMSDFIEKLKERKTPGNGTLKESLFTKNSEFALEMKVEDWGDFKICDYFHVKKGRRLTRDDQTEGYTPYIGAIDSNNGLSNYIGQGAIHKANTISLSYNGSVGEAFYQPYDFWATDDVNVLYAKANTKLNKYTALFICAILRQEKYRYSYGRKWVLESMKSTIIKLPKDSSGNPDWHFMEKKVKSLPFGDRI